MFRGRSNAGIVLGLVAAIAGAATAFAADGAIKVQRGIAQASLGMSREDVREMWGPADTVAVSREDDGNVKFVRMRWKARKLSATFIDTTESNDVESPGSSLLSVSTRNRAHRTSTHVGPGTTERTLRRYIPKARCSVYRGQRSCALGEPGSRQTVFKIRNARVTEVVVGDVF